MLAAKALEEAEYQKVRIVLGYKQVQGQPGLHENLSQNNSYRKKKKSQSSTGCNIPEVAAACRFLFVDLF